MKILVLLLTILASPLAWAQNPKDGTVTVSPDGEVTLHFPTITGLAGDVQNIIDHMLGVKKPGNPPQLGQRSMDDEVGVNHEVREEPIQESYQLTTSTGQKFQVEVVGQVNDRKDIVVTVDGAAHRFQLEADLLPMLTQNPMLVSVAVKGKSLHLDDGFVPQILNATYMGAGKESGEEDPCIRSIQSALHHTAYSDKLLAEFIKLQKDITYHKLAYAYLKLDKQQQGVEKTLLELMKQKHGAKFAEIAKDFSKLKTHDADQSIFLLLALEDVQHVLLAQGGKDDQFNLDGADIKTIALYRQKHSGVNFVKMVDDAYANPKIPRSSSIEVQKKLQTLLKEMETLTKGLIHVSCFEPAGQSCKQSAPSVDAFFQKHMGQISSMMLDALFKKEEEHFGQNKP